MAETDVDLVILGGGSGGYACALRAAELLLLAVLGGFVLVESASYAWRIFTLGQTSNTAGIPMWLPHSGVALGFALITIFAFWRVAKFLRRGGFDRRPAEGGEGAP